MYHRNVEKNITRILYVVIKIIRDAYIIFYKFKISFKH